jgi:hypothetical protein
MKKEFIIDQKLDDIRLANLGCCINEGFPFVGQTFTAGIDGFLAAVSVQIRSKRGLNPKENFEFFNLKISIYNIENGFPKDELQSIILDKDESTIDEIIELLTPIEQKEGQQFAVLANYPNGPKHGAGQSLGNWAGLSNNKYPMGNLVFGDNKSWFISSLNNHDVFFRTYVRKDKK